MDVDNAFNRQSKGFKCQFYGTSIIVTVVTDTTSVRATGQIFFMLIELVLYDYDCNNLLA